MAAKRGGGALLDSFLKSAPKPLPAPDAGALALAPCTHESGASGEIPAPSFQRYDVGIHYGVPEASYHADCALEPSLSAGFGTKMLDTNPNRAKFGHPRLNPGAAPFVPTTAMDEGTILHRLILGAGPEYHVLDADSWRTNAAKDARERARACGAVPVLAERFSELEVIAKFAYDALAENVEDCQVLSDDYASEVTCIWRERTGALCRTRPDRLHRSDGSAPVYDFKFTDKLDSPAEWDRTIVSSHWDMRAAFYSRGLAELRDGEDPPYRFIIIEKKPPYDMIVLELVESFLKQGHAKAAHIISGWERCMAAGRWPSYPRRVFYIEEPGWSERKMLDSLHFLNGMLPGARAVRTADEGDLRDMLKQAKPARAALPKDVEPPPPVSPLD